MTDLFELISYMVNTFGYWATALFAILSAIPLLSIVYITFSGTSLGKILDKRVASKIEEQQEIHREGNRLRKEFNKNVIEILQKLASDTEADRAVLFEYSNGTSNLVGLPFLYMSATAEVVTPLATPIGHQYQKVNTSILAKFLIELEEKSLIFIKDLKESKEEYPILAYFMLPNNAKSALFYSIEGVAETIGFLIITTTTNSGISLNRNYCIPYVARAAQKIGALLNLDELTSLVTKAKKNRKFK